MASSTTARSWFRSSTPNEDSPGDDLTNSEDIFVGFAFCDRGWDNVRIPNTYTRSAVPGIRGVLEQNYLWGSGFIQSAYYFGRLSRRLRSRKVVADGGTETTSRRMESTETEESSRLETREATKRPMGWAVLTQLIDGLYPTLVFLLLLLSAAGVVAVELALSIVAIEFTMYVFLALVTRSDRLEISRNLPAFVVVRLIALPVLTYTYLRVGTNIALGNRDWRK